MKCEKNAARIMLETKLIAVAKNLRGFKKTGPTSDVVASVSDCLQSEEIPSKNPVSWEKSNDTFR
ncbi:MAG: hypothetical protein GY795_06595 [Desulfobacterales bacterium]|nr:hypothetical protein [Desulfobacterales bacterium]